METGYDETFAAGKLAQRLNLDENSLISPTKSQNDEGFERMLAQAPN